MILEWSRMLRVPSCNEAEGLEASAMPRVGKHMTGSGCGLLKRRERRNMFEEKALGVRARFESFKECDHRPHAGFGRRDERHHEGGRAEAAPRYVILQGREIGDKLIAD